MMASRLWNSAFPATVAVVCLIFAIALDGRAQSEAVACYLLASLYSIITCGKAFPKSPRATTATSVVVVVMLWRSFSNQPLVGIGIDFAVFAAGAIVPLVVWLGGKLVYWRWKNHITIRATRLAQSGDLPGAMALLHEQVDLHGSSGRVYADLAVLAVWDENWNEALSMAERAEDLGEKSPELLYSKGIALWKCGRLEDAEECLQAALQMAPNITMTMCNLGLVLVDSGRYAEAEDMLDRAKQSSRDFLVLNRKAREVQQRCLNELRKKVERALDESTRRLESQ